MNARSCYAGHLGEAEQQELEEEKQAWRETLMLWI